MEEKDDHTQLALLEQRQIDDARRILILEQQVAELEKKRISELEHRVGEIDRQVFAGKVGVVVLMGVGSFVGWLLSISDKVKAWFH